MNPKSDLKMPPILKSETLAAALEAIPAGISITDLEGRLLYYNAYCTRYVDRRPEYIGTDIRSCHRKAASVQKIDTIFAEMQTGKREEYYYEAVRKGQKIGVTITPFKRGDEVIGFLHCFVAIR